MAEITTNEKITNALNKYTPLARENFRTEFKNTFVTLKSGKDLSTEDFTTAEKYKLANIETGAEVNTCELETAKVIESPKEPITKIVQLLSKKFHLQLLNFQSR